MSEARAKMAMWLFTSHNRSALVSPVSSASTLEQLAERHLSSLFDQYLDVVDAYNKAPASYRDDALELFKSHHRSSVTGMLGLFEAYLDVAKAFKASASRFDPPREPTRQGSAA